jgi:hypothetical protein
MKTDWEPEFESLVAKRAERDAAAGFNPSLLVVGGTGRSRRDSVRYRPRRSTPHISRIRILALGLHI